MWQTWHVTEMKNSDPTYVVPAAIVAAPEIGNWSPALPPAMSAVSLHRYANLDVIDGLVTSHQPPTFILVVWPLDDPDLVSVLQSVRQRQADVPLLLAGTATVDASVVVDLVRAGAADVLQVDMPAELFTQRLASAVVRWHDELADGHWQSLLSQVNRLPTLVGFADALVDEALRRSGGRQRGAADLLGVTQQAISSRLQRRRTQEPGGA